MFWSDIKLLFVLTKVGIKNKNLSNSLSVTVKKLNLLLKRQNQKKLSTFCHMQKFYVFRYYVKKNFLLQEMVHEGGGRWAGLTPTLLPPFLYGLVGVKSFYLSLSYGFEHETSWLKQGGLNKYFYFLFYFHFIYSR